ncbi:MAG: type II toxin-antitoxin system VapC family toxin [Patescibacteria group bacterium]
MYTLDTNVIIYYIKEDAEVIRTVDKILTGGYAMYVSAISEVELFRFPQLEAVETEKIEALLGTVSIIAVDSQIARSAANLGKMHGLDTADSVIAATALFTGTTLLTRNVRDFKKAPNLRVERA